VKDFPLIRRKSFTIMELNCLDARRGISLTKRHWLIVESVELNLYLSVIFIILKIHFVRRSL
jgi:hypothetical protein